MLNLDQYSCLGAALRDALDRWPNEICLIEADRVDPVTGEQRWHAIGAVGNEPEIVGVLLVVHVYREELNGEEIIRIISARAAEKHELRRHQKQTIDRP